MVPKCDEICGRHPGFAPMLPPQGPKASGVIQREAFQPVIADNFKLHMVQAGFPCFTTTDINGLPRCPWLQAIPRFSFAPTSHLRKPQGASRRCRESKSTICSHSAIKCRCPEISSRNVQKPAVNQISNYWN